MAGVADTTTEYRLKRSIDAFPASDGSLYLLRTGAGEDTSSRTRPRGTG